MSEPDTSYDVSDLGGDLLDMLKMFLLVLNAVLLVAGLLVAARSGGPKHVGDPAVDTSTDTKRALLVTAHPDDESMFFLPLVHSLTVATPREWELHLLCLSRGDFDGLGAVRERELHACSAFLGLAPANVRVLEDPALQDGMETQWPPTRIAEIVLAYMDQHEISAVRSQRGGGYVSTHTHRLKQRLTLKRWRCAQVFTFDDYGVSGHPNHMATHHGVQLALQEQHAQCEDPTVAAASRKVRGWALESTSLVRKYVGVADAVVSTWTLPADGAFVFLCRPWWNYAAMALHRSQFVWYRRLFVAFSRYTFVNTFVPLVVPDTSPNKKTQ